MLAPGRGRTHLDPQHPFQPLGDLPQFPLDHRQRRTPVWRLQVREDQVDIDRQPGHIPKKQVDRGAPLQGEAVRGENERRHVDQQAHRLQIAAIHAPCSRGA